MLKISVATFFDMPLSPAPLTNDTRCCAMTSAFFLPIARRMRSDCASVKPAMLLASCITCSWNTMMPLVDLRIGSMLGWRYSMGLRPNFRSMNSSMKSIGPGRYNAFIAAKSSMERGLSFESHSRMPDDSNWKTPTVCPSPIISKVFSSSRGIVSMSMSIFRVCLIKRSARSMTLSVIKPRKSIFTAPPLRDRPCCTWSSARCWGTCTAVRNRWCRLVQSPLPRRACPRCG